MKPSFPNNHWVMTGQMELGAEGTEHYQGMLKTPQVRFSAVKKLLPRAHIELAKNVSALAKYVSKQETRLAEVAQISSNIPTLFDYNHSLARKWKDDEFERLTELYVINNSQHGIDDVALMYVDQLVSDDIRSGVQGVEFIAINPMFRSAWKKFWKSMLARERAQMILETQDIKDAPVCQEDLSSPKTSRSSSRRSSQTSAEWIY